MSSAIGHYVMLGRLALAIGISCGLPDSTSSQTGVSCNNGAKKGELATLMPSKSRRGWECLVREAQKTACLHRSG